MRRILLASVLCLGFLVPIAHVAFPAPVVRAADMETKVYTTKTGKKYHKSTCRYVRGKDNTTSMTVDEAKRKRYTACSVCKPPEK